MNDTNEVFYKAAHAIYLAAEHLVYALEFYQHLEQAQSWATAFNEYAKEQEIIEGQRHLKVRVHGAINALASRDLAKAAKDTRMLLAYTYEMVEAKVGALYEAALYAEPTSKNQGDVYNWCREAKDSAIAAVAIVRALWADPPVDDVDEEGEDRIEVARKRVQGLVNRISVRATWIRMGETARPETL